MMVSMEQRPKWWPKSTEEARLLLAKAANLRLYLVKLTSVLLLAIVGTIGVPGLVLVITTNRVLEGTLSVGAYQLLAFATFAYSCGTCRVWVGSPAKGHEDALLTQLIEAIYKTPATPDSLAILLSDFPDIFDDEV